MSEPTQSEGSEIERRVRFMVGYVPFPEEFFWYPKTLHDVPPDVCIEDVTFDEDLSPMTFEIVAKCVEKSNAHYIQLKLQVGGCKPCRDSDIANTQWAVVLEETPAGDLYIIDPRAVCVTDKLLERLWAAERHETLAHVKETICHHVAVFGMYATKAERFELLAALAKVPSYLKASWWRDDLRQLEWDEVRDGYQTAEPEVDQ